MKELMINEIESISGGGCDCDCVCITKEIGCQPGGCPPRCVHTHNIDLGCAESISECMVVCEKFINSTGLAMCSFNCKPIYDSATKND